MIQGLRPQKPGNASAIGFSDLLWSLVQRCWDGDMKLRPRIAEVAARLGEAAANWKGLMPPCAQAENAASDSEPMQYSMEHSEFEILIVLQCCPPSMAQAGPPNRLRLSPSRILPYCKPPLALDYSTVRIHYTPNTMNRHRKNLRKLSLNLPRSYTTLR